MHDYKTDRFYQHLLRKIYHTRAEPINYLEGFEVMI